MKILITGASGFIGSHVLRELLTKKHEIYVLVRNTSDLRRIKEFHSRVHIITYSSIPSLSKKLQKIEVDGVIHLATKYIKVLKEATEISEMVESNIVFPSILLEEFSKRTQSPWFINTGTCFEYKPLRRPISETDPLMPFNYYASTKIAFEEVLKYYVHTAGITAVTLKLFFPYGENDNPKLMQLLVSSLMHNKKILLTPGKQRLSFTNVHDIVDAYLQTISYLSKRKRQYEVFNIGDNNAYTIREVIKELEQISQSTLPASYTLPYPPREILYMKCQNEKARKILKWQPRYSLKNGLKKMYDYYKRFGI